jgi:hypothetical protein
MEWFSLWLPLVSQVVVPVTLLAWLAYGSHATRARSIVVVALVATYVVAIGIAGLWLAFPWWLPFSYGAVVVWAIARRLRAGDDRTPRPRVVWELVVTVLIGALAALLIGTIGLALAGRWPPFEPIELAFPLRSGTYLVVNGGSEALINAHLSTLEGERFAPYRGQSYGVDARIFGGEAVIVDEVLVNQDRIATTLQGGPDQLPIGRTRARARRPHGPRVGGDLRSRNCGI